MKTTGKLTVVPTTKPSPLERLVEDYCADARARGLSPKSIKYGVAWPLREIFLPWAADNGITAVEQLDNRTCNQFSAHLQEHGGKQGQLKPASIWSYSKAVRRFMSWAEQEGERVPGQVKLNKLPRREVEVLTAREIEALENTAATERDKVIVQVLAQTGIRRAELVGLTDRDLVEQGGRSFLRIHGKGGRDRRVPLSPALARRLRKLIAGRPKDADTDRVFVALRKRPGAHSIEPLTESGITQMILGVGEKAGIERRVHPHMLRHTFATIALRRGMDSLMVAEVMGHSSLQMLSRVYSHTTPTDAHVALMKVLVAEDE